MKLRLNDNPLESLIEYQKSREKFQDTYKPKLSKDPRLFNEQIGMPVDARSPTLQPTKKLTKYQLDILEYKGKDLIINKANKIGITETILRDIIYRATIGDCQGFQIILTSSMEGLAQNNLKRLTRIFLHSDLLRPYLKKTLETSLELTNETEIFILASTQKSGRSWERVKYIFADEAAHIGLLDDSEFFTSLSGRRINTGGYMRLVSTPKGQRGTFYEQSMKAIKGDFPAKYIELPYYVGLGTFFTEEEIESEKKRQGPHMFEQEFLCKFITSSNAAIESFLVDDAVDSSLEADPC